MKSKNKMIPNTPMRTTPSGAVERQTICIVGAGIIGVATALSLHEAGHNIILVEKEEAPAQKSSSLNGCQLSYSFVDAMASPATLKIMPKLAFGLDPSFRVHVGTMISNSAWLLSFLANSSEARFQANTLSALHLAKLSQDVLHRWEAEYNLEFGRKRSGKLVLIGSEKVRARMKKSIELKRFGSIQQQLLSKKNVLQLEPAVDHFNGSVVGAIHTPHDEVGDPQAFCSSATSFLKNKKRATLLLGHTVEDIVLRNGAISHLLVDNKPLQADLFVFCAGHLTSILARCWGERLPIIPMAGYSVTMPATDKAPNVPLTDLETKTVVTPIGDSLRCAGFADLGHFGEIADGERVRVFKRSLQSRFGAMVSGCQQLETWIGHRPMTPNSLPIIRKSKLSNAFLNCGHGMLGWTMAAGSAEILTRTIDAHLQLR